jgi:hypothetical protein
MPNEILTNIMESLHRTATACLSVTYTKMYTFFHEQSTIAYKPILTTMVPYEPLVSSRNSSMHVTGNSRTKQLWELLEVYMEPRLWVGHYGLDKFINVRTNQEVRNDYWKLYPQRPLSTEEPSPWLREGSDAIDVKGTVRELERKFQEGGFDTEMVRLGTAGLSIGGTAVQQDSGAQPRSISRYLIHSLNAEAMHRLSPEE